MKVTADTNVLVRAAVGLDDPAQAAASRKALAAAALIAVPLPILCEFVWVLQRGYRYDAGVIGSAIRRLMVTANVVLDHAATEAGLAMLEAGGDFADGVSAFTGRQLGGEVFLSFDRRAVRLLRDYGAAAATP